MMLGAVAVAVAGAGGAGALAAARRGGDAPAPAQAAQLGPGITLTGHTGVVEAVAFGPGGRLLATGGSDAPRIWDVATARTLRTLDTANVRGVAFSPDGRLLATAHDDSFAALWDVSSGRRTATFRTERFAVWTVAFSPDGRTLATGNPDVRLWDLRTGRATVFDTGPLTRNPQGDPAPNTVLKVEFSPDGRTLAAAQTGYGEGGGQGAVLVWDVATRRRTALLRGPGEDTRSLAFLRGGASIAVCGESAEIALWDVAARRITASFTGHLDEVRGLTGSKDGTTLASCGVDRNVHLWDVASRRTTAVLTGHTQLLDTLALSPDGRTAAAAGGQDDHAVRIWKVR
ncbi:WD40 repeat domain-containing protein [Actinomadura sp. KC345]|nr:WD40 repeat domain-containing protein [Actinomadura sp. KC345]